jgi:hypothetical protein
MQEREKRLAIAAILTVAHIPVVNIHFGAIWQAGGCKPRANPALLTLLAVWIASATVLSIQVSGDLSKPFREQANVPSRSPWRDSCELRRGSDV